ncbi:hypothetical protein EKO04_008542 [Ascochyta lentis]|uniref:Major facilitator superfamily (MFS) profile domain-containing protein n=1 Tax=Ascochyta lentis TaxID=205686 RepID=A0A8H7MHL8_9PLEO|nr:hypothetical protein EKO04_008542 [Ascochyta lentis]
MTDTAAEPLINDRDDRDERDARYSEEAEDVHVDESALVSPGVFIWTLTLCAGVSGLLFGYDTGVISSTLVSINSDLSSRPLTTLDKSLITSATSFFALLASPLTGLLADAAGRKPVILAADLLFVLGALWQAYTTSVWGMIAGRSVVGAAVGSASFVVPLYISELSPSPFRGRLVTVLSLFITGGQVVAYVIGWAFSEKAGGWRWMVGLGAMPAIAQFGMLFFMPETPRFLVKRGKKAQARRVLSRVYGSATGMEKLVNAVLRSVEREILEEEQTTPSAVKHDNAWTAKLTNISETFTQLVSVGANRRALIIACMLQAAQQLCGFNSLMYFSATIFQLVGFHSPTLTSLSIAVTNFAFTLVAFCVLIPRPPPPSHHPIDSHPTRRHPHSPWPPTILAATLLYVSAYATGLGCVPWQQSELFPLRVRALGSALATTTNWASNTVVGLSFLPLMEAASPSVAFAAYALVCGGAWVAVWGVYPETAGLGLEDVGGLLAGGFGVQESVRRFRERGGGGG